MPTRARAWPIVSLALPLSAFAHHSFVVVYDTERSVQVEGTLTRFLDRNPHALLQIETLDASGSRQQWKAEWGSRGQLVREGVGADSLRVGDRVVVSGNPGRDESQHILRVQGVRRTSDGWTWQGVTK